MYRLGLALHDRLVRWLGHGIALIGFTFFIILILGKDELLRSYVVPFVAVAIALALITMFLRIGFLSVQDDGHQPPAISGVEMPQRNWSRGFFRLWLVGSIIWIGIAIVMSILFAHWPEEFRYQLQEILAIFGVVIGPPAATLILGLALRWILQGFQRET